jgi:pimeloyl-ACP methyl ester carboxylesterase
MGRITVNTAILASGLTVPYGETGNPAAIPVVFVHAYVESWRYFEVVLGHLPASLHGYAPTQRGHGDADRPAAGYLTEDFAADIVGFMDVVGIRRAVLVGSSSGGLVSQLVASTYPDRVSALVLISSPASLAHKPGVAAMWQAISVLEDPLDRGFVEEFVRGTSPESVPDELVDTLIDESLKAPARRLVGSGTGAVTRSRPVSSPRPSNRACGSPAHGSPTSFTGGVRPEPARPGWAGVRRRCH